MLHWHFPREDLIGVIALIVYVITCGSLSGGRNGSILDSHTIYFFPLERSTSKSHPCAYGGKGTRERIKENVGESPPRMRGKGDCPEVDCIAVRITPAHAGKSCRLHQHRIGDRDHPRACGEKPRVLKDWTAKPGSPPRMRGKVCWLLCGLWSMGITPAHAGKSF